MKHNRPRNEHSRVPEGWQMLLALVTIALLFAACVFVPFLLARSFGVWLGLTGAVIAMVCWIQLVRPMPGLGQAVIAFSGLTALAVLLIAWIGKVILHVFS